MFGDIKVGLTMGRINPCVDQLSSIAGRRRQWIQKIGTELHGMNGDEIQGEKSPRTTYANAAKGFFLHLQTLNEQGQHTTRVQRNKYQMHTGFFPWDANFGEPLTAIEMAAADGFRGEMHNIWDYDVDNKDDVRSVVSDDGSPNRYLTLHPREQDGMRAATSPYRCHAYAPRPAPLFRSTNLLVSPRTAARFTRTASGPQFVPHRAAAAMRAAQVAAPRGLSTAAPRVLSFGVETTVSPRPITTTPTTLRSPQGAHVPAPAVTNAYAVRPRSFPLENTNVLMPPTRSPAAPLARETSTESVRLGESSLCAEHVSRNKSAPKSPLTSICEAAQQVGMVNKCEAPSPQHKLVLSQVASHAMSTSSLCGPEEIASVWRTATSRPVNQQAPRPLLNVSMTSPLLHPVPARQGTHEMSSPLPLQERRILASPALSQVRSPLVASPPARHTTLTGAQDTKHKTGPQPPARHTTATGAQELTIKHATGQPPPPVKHTIAHRTLHAAAHTTASPLRIRYATACGAQHAMRYATTSPTPVRYATASPTRHAVRHISPSSKVRPTEYVRVPTAVASPPQHLRMLRPALRGMIRGPVMMPPRMNAQLPWMASRPDAPRCGMWTKPGFT